MLTVLVSLFWKRVPASGDTIVSRRPHKQRTGYTLPDRVSHLMCDNLTNGTIAFRTSDSN